MKSLNEVDGEWGICTVLKYSFKDVSDFYVCITHNNQGVSRASFLWKPRVVHCQVIPLYDSLTTRKLIFQKKKKNRAGGGKGNRACFALGTVFQFCKMEKF